VRVYARVLVPPNLYIHTYTNPRAVRCARVVGNISTATLNRFRNLFSCSCADVLPFIVPPSPPSDGGWFEQGLTH